MKHLHCTDVTSFDAPALGLEGTEKMKLRLLSEDSVWIELEPGSIVRKIGLPLDEEIHAIVALGQPTEDEIDVKTIERRR